MHEVRRPGLEELLGLTDEEALLPVGCRIVPSLSGTGLFRRLVLSSEYHAAPAWVCYAGRALHDLRVSEAAYAALVRALLDREELREALAATWRLSLAERAVDRVRAVLLSELLVFLGPPPKAPRDDPRRLPSHPGPRS